MKRVDWVRFHHDFPEHDDIEALSDAAFRAWVRGICLSDRLDTDGRLTKIKWASIARPRVKAELVSAGLWMETDAGGIEILQYLKWQRSAAQKREARQANAQRQEAKRLGISVDELRERHANITRDITRDDGVTTGTEGEGESEREVSRGQRLLKGSRRNCHFQLAPDAEYELEKLLKTIGCHADGGTEGVLRSFVRQLGPRSSWALARVRESLQVYPVDCNKAGYAVGALKSIIEEEKRVA